MTPSPRDKAVLIAARRLSNLVTAGQIAKYVNSAGVAVNVGQVFHSLDILETFQLVRSREFVNGMARGYLITGAGIKWLNEYGLAFVSDVVCGED